MSVHPVSDLLCLQKPCVLGDLKLLKVIFERGSSTCLLIVVMAELDIVHSVGFSLHLERDSPLNVNTIYSLIIGTCDVVVSVLLGKDCE